MTDQHLRPYKGVDVSKGWTVERGNFAMVWGVIMEVPHHVIFLIHFDRYVKDMTQFFYGCTLALV